MRSKNKNALFGRYPSCDMLNNALRFIRDGQIQTACEEIIIAIEKADGYFHKDIIPFIQEVRSNGERIIMMSDDKSILADIKSGKGLPPINS